MPNTMQELGAQIGGLFFNQNKGVAYRDQMDKNARSRALMADARSKQAQALMDELRSEHYQKIPGMVAEFGSPNLASLVAAGDGNAQQFMLGVAGVFVESGWRRDSAAAGAAGSGRCRCAGTAPAFAGGRA